MNIISIYKAFPDHASCIRHLEEIRWGNNPGCPYCQWNKTCPTKGTLRHHCNKCNRSFSATVGTIFQDTKLDLQKWYLAIILILNAKKGISSRQLARDIGVNKDTGWYMQMRIRAAMAEEDVLLDGIVEVDETYVGGNLSNKSAKEKQKHREAGGAKTGMEHKIPVLGMLQRKGKILAQVVEKAYGKVIRPILYEKISQDSTLVTDGFGAYIKAGKHFKDHQRLNHSKEEFARGIYHTNTLDGFWGLLKRGIVGQYHNLSTAYLQAYLDEFTFKQNYKSPEFAFNLLINRMLTRSYAY